MGASALGYADWPAPHEMSTDEIAGLVYDFARAAARATAAGFDVAEVHAAHGYLLHQFLSPLSNHRDDAYGGSFDNRVRLLLEVTRAVRDEWPQEQPLLVRLSATDWVDGGWDLADTVRASRRLGDLGVDLVDVSSGGLDPAQQIPAGPGFQVPFARAVRDQAGIATSAVGLITEPAQAEQVLREGARTRSCWRASCCATRTGRCGPRPRWERTGPGRHGTSVPLAERRRPILAP